MPYAFTWHNELTHATFHCTLLAARHMSSGGSFAAFCRRADAPRERGCHAARKNIMTEDQIDESQQEVCRLRYARVRAPRALILRRCAMSARVRE